MDPLTIRQLQGFVAAAEELHFGRAAVRMGISQPSLSQLIGRVEDVIDVKLFDRRPMVRLTEAGALLLPQVRNALQALDRGVQGVHELASGRTGHLRIRFAASVLTSPFPDILRKFRRQFPLVQVSLQKHSSASIKTDLNDDEIGVARYPPTQKPSNAITLVHEPFLIALPSEHKLLRRDHIDLAMLREESFIHFPRHEAPALHNEIQRACQAKGFTPRVVLEATEWLTIMGLVRSGLGIAFVPASFQSLQWSGAEYCSLNDGAPTSSVFIWHKPRKASPTTTHFMKAAIASAKSLA